MSAAATTDKLVRGEIRRLSTDAVRRQSRSQSEHGRGA